MNQLLTDLLPRLFKGMDGHKILPRNLKKIDDTIDFCTRASDGVDLALYACLNDIHEEKDIEQVAELLKHANYVIEQLTLFRDNIKELDIRLTTA